MSEMIKRVARAIYDGEIRPGGGGHILLAYSVMEEKYLVRARAAIESMREPTKSMVTAAGALEDQEWRDKGEREDGATHWRAMIDAALKDG